MRCSARGTISTNDPIAAEKLIQAGADVDWKGNSGKTLASYAAGLNSYTILRLLLDHGADYRVIDKTNGLTAVQIFGSNYRLMQSSSESGRQYREIAVWFEKRGVSIERARDQWELWQNKL